MKKPILPSEITLRFHPSQFLWGWWLVFSIAVLFSLWLSLSPLWACVGTLLYVGAGFWEWTQLVATQWRCSVHELKVDVFGQMAIIDTMGRLWRIEILPESVVHHGCMVLHIAYKELQKEAYDEADARLKDSFLSKYLRPTRLLILFDHADTSSQKALRVWLKWGLRD